MTRAHAQSPATPISDPKRILKKTKSHQNPTPSSSGTSNKPQSNHSRKDKVVQSSKKEKEEDVEGHKPEIYEVSISYEVIEIHQT